jgi:hypothetical protein
MRNQQPDNFFRERLADHHKQPPASAWDKIEKSLKKNEPKFVWWKVAASLLLLISVAYILWLQSSGKNNQAISQASSEIESPDLNAVEPELKISEKSDAASKARGDEGATIANANGNKQGDKKFIDKKIKNPQPKATARKLAEVAPFVSNTGQEILQPTETPIAENVSRNVTPPTQVVKKSSSITLTITAEESEKYLDKNALAEATSNERKSSTFKKLLKKANELTSNQDPFGDLRVKKNEILALEFRNDKRGQNK